MDTLRLIVRVDLLAALDRAAARKVTIISAPVGSGKTSLLRAWADYADRAHRIAFVPVRRDQEDAQEFWLALLNAVRQASSTTSDTEPPTAAPDFNVRAIADRVLSELADPSVRITVVIDDLHELNAPGALDQLRLLRQTCWPDSPIVSSVTSAQRTRPPNGPLASPRLTGWSCRSR